MKIKFNEYLTIILMFIVLIVLAIVFAQALNEYARPKPAPEYEEFGDYFKDK